MAGQRYRIEKDSMGEVKVPQEAYYGAPNTAGSRKFLTYPGGAGKKIALGVQTAEFFAIKFSGNKVTTKGVLSFKDHTP